MNVLVTGASGFLGRALVERMVVTDAGRIRCLVRPGPRRAALDELARRRPEARLDIELGSLASVAAADRALGDADIVYHLAAAMAGAPADIFLNTVVTSKNLLEALVRRRPAPSVVLVSSFALYGVADLPRGTIVDEGTPLEPHPERRDLYSQAKIRQERLFWEYRQRHGLAVTVLRPGVIYGPGAGPLSSRVGLSVPGVFLALGGRNLLPLTYVDNCADALLVAGRRVDAQGQVYNVVDDDLPTCRDYLRLYQAAVQPLRTLTVPYPALQALSHLVERYHRHSQGQLPAFFTPYRTATTWKGNRFSNTKLKALGWRQRIPTAEGMQLTFTHHRQRQAPRAAA